MSVPIRATTTTITTTPVIVIAATLILPAVFAVAEQGPAYGPADPVIKDLRRLYAKRPIAQEMRTDVPDGFTAGGRWGICSYRGP